MNKSLIDQAIATDLLNNLDFFGTSLTSTSLSLEILPLFH